MVFEEVGRSRSRSPLPRSSRRDYDSRGDSRNRRDYDDRRPRDSPRDYDRRKGEGSSRRYYSDDPRREDRERDRRPREDSDRRDRDGRDRERRPRDEPYRDERPPRRRSHSRLDSSPPSPKKAEPNFGNSGLLAAATNTVKASDGSSTVLKYNEPPEARKPTQAWRLYVFKGKEDLGLLQIAKQSAYLIGRDQLVADIPIDHPSCSKQHAVIQYRQVQEKDGWGAVKAVVKPFIIDLESTNGTFVNETAIPVSRYYELKASDVIKFGQSTREYVLLNEDDA